MISSVPMLNYAQYQEQYGGFTDVMDTVKTVQKIAASRIRPTKLLAQELENYQKEVESALATLLPLADTFYQPLLAASEHKNTGLLIICGEKGLVGDLYQRLAKAAQKKDYRHIWIIGGQSARVARQIGNPVDKLDPDDIGKLIDSFLSKDIDSAELLFAKNISIAQQEIELKTILPLNLSIIDGATSLSPNPIVEPDLTEFLRSLLKRHITVQIRQAIVNTHLSEFSARTVTMENAVSNTKQILTKIRLQYLKDRKHQVTQRQIESFTSLIKNE